MKNTINLGEGNVKNIFIRYAIPAILGMVAMTSAQIIDGIFVGRFVGPNALAAISLAMPILMVLFGIGMMMGVGGATLANIKRGEEKIEQSNNYYSVTISLIAMISLIATLICIFFSKNIASILGADKTTHADVVTYISILGLFLFPYLINTSLDMFLRNDGFPNFPIICIGSGSILNIILDYILIAKLEWGIAGAALATGLAQLLPMLAMVIFIIKKSTWKFVKPIFKFNDIKYMVFNGSSEMFSNISVGISGFLFNLIIMKEIGTAGITAYTISIYATTISIAIFYGVANAIAPGVSFNIGKGDIVRVFSFRNMGVITNILIGVILCLILFLLGDKLAYLFVGEDEVIRELAVRITRFAAASLTIAGVNIVASMYYTSINQPLISVIIAISRSLIMLVLGLFILPNIMGQDGIWASYIFAELTTLLIVLYYFKKRPY
ncbi:MAG: hypothetical protein ATN32_07180 [Candidatus Epulonipiscium fishelsonii]|nr:MAG: hypothetical protein ATN32_07180 [Epulopiscium sp. AS2M-Bin002]